MGLVIAGKFVGLVGRAVLCTPRTVGEPPKRYPQGGAQRTARPPLPKSTQSPHFGGWG